VTNWVNDLRFQLALARLSGAIAAAATLGVCDARAIRWRAAGGANLQGHENALVPVALLLAMQNPSLVRQVRRSTSLIQSMRRGSTESQDKALRDDIAAALRGLRATHGTDIVSHQLRNNLPISVDHACRTYLSTRFNGSQQNGGAGDTVIKRTLKLIAQFRIV
jgi:hypothetical protein